MKKYRNTTINGKEENKTEEEKIGNCRERINESVFRQSNRDIEYKKFLHEFQLFFFVSEKSKKVIF